MQIYQSSSGFSATSHSPQSHGYGRAEHHIVTICIQSKLRAGLSRAACANIKNNVLTIDLCRFTHFTLHGSSELILVCESYRVPPAVHMLQFLGHIFRTVQGSDQRVERRGMGGGRIFNHTS
jgi:hypothetical protein